MNEQWENMKPVNLETVKNLLMEDYKKHWRVQVNTKVKLENFKNLNPDFTVSPHLTVNLNKYERSLISQIRLGTLALQIKVGCYNHVKQEDRLCNLCSTAVESKLHFLFECTMFDNERKKLYNKMPEL